MSGKPSPSSTITSAASPVASPQSLFRNHSSRVIVVKQPPKYVYADEWFEVDFDIDIEKGKGPSLKDADFVATLHHYKSGRPTDDDATFVVVPVSPIRFSVRETPSRRKRTLRCKIRPKEVLREKPMSYFVQLSPRNDTRSDSAVDVLPGSTHPIRVVNYKINLSYEEGWENVWYKDEGGREKCMTATANLLNKEGVPCTGEPVPLQLTLFYDNGDQSVIVLKQNILRTVGGSKLTMDKRTGKSVLRFRIDDVSKNHQGQDFRVEVAVDARSKNFYDIAPAFTPSVSVRSKRNKRQRSSASSTKSEVARYGSPIRTQPHGFLGSDPVMGTEGPFSSADVPRLREAMKGVVQWTEEVVSGLFPLQWQVIGYAQNPDGSSDFSRPYHSMQNPNECISRVLSMYTESTREQLRILSSAIERSSPSQHGDQSVARLPGPRGSEYDVMGGPGLPVSSPYAMDPRFGPRGVPMQAAMARSPFIPGAYPLADSFRDKGDMGSSGYTSQTTYGGPQQMQMHTPMGLLGQPLPTATMATMPGQLPSVPEESRARKPHDTGQPEREFEEETGESEVAYVLAKQYKAKRTGERLGFPAYSESKEILGFYRESSMKVGVGQFLPISRHREDFGPAEKLQATQILNEAIERKSDAVYALKDWGTISNLIDHALVYDWSKDITTAANNSGSSSGVSGE